MQVDNVLLGAKSAIILQEAITPAATAADSSVEQEFTFAGIPALRTTDGVIAMGPGSGNALALGGAHVSGVNKIKIAFVNPTAGSLTYAAGTFTFLVVRK